MAARLRRRLWAGGLVLAALAVTALALLATGTISVDLRLGSKGPGRIAFVDAAGGLSTIAADGTGLRTSPAPGLAFGFPAWSPDGRLIAVIGHEGAAGGVFVVDDHATGAAAGPAATYRSPDGDPIYLSWSPDGRRIAILTGEADGLSLRLVPADGAASATVVRRGQPFYWAWVDADHLFVHSGGAAADAFLGEVGLAAGDVTPIDAQAGSFQAPGISADGRYRAYVATVAGEGPKVVVEARDGTARHEVVLRGASALGWSPAGDALAYTAPSDANGLPVGPLRLLDARTGATRLLLDGSVVAYFWSPDARTIAALLIPQPGTDVAAISADQARLAIAVVGPDGGRLVAQVGQPALRLVFIDVAGGAVRSELRVALPADFLAQFLPFFDQYASSHRLWSPAGDAIVLPILDDGGVARITIVPAAGAAPRRLADGVAAFWSP